MPNHTVTIGVQARSTSTRLPNKINAQIGSRKLLDHVLDSCKKATLYLNNWNTKSIIAETFLLIPKGDPIKDRFNNIWASIEGDEHDVLSRYVNLQKWQKSAFIVRVTGDCPLIPSFVISKMITLAVMNNYDYVSNVDERVRTAPDGFDCEVVSKRMLAWLDENAKSKEDREHVTLLARREFPDYYKQACMINYMDLSGIKLSVDTNDDLTRVIEEYIRVEKKVHLANKIFGKSAVHRV